MELLDIIIVNDGSSDKTSFIAKRFESLYPDSIRVIDKENGNYGSCVNNGIEIAKGKYVKILDGDDYLNNNVLSNYIHKLLLIDQIYDVDMILTNFQTVDSQGNIIGVCKLGMKSESVIPVKNLSCIEQLQHHFITYKLDRLKLIDYHQTEGIPYTDQEWISIPLFAMRNAYYIDSSPLYSYLLGREGQSMEQSVLIKHADSLICILRNMVVEYEKHIIKFNDNHLCVLRRILSFGNHVYSFFIVKHYRELDQQPIQDFDKWLKEYNADLYHKFDMCTFSDKMSIRFIKKWRRKSHVIYILRELYYLYMLGRA